MNYVTFVTSLVLSVLIANFGLVAQEFDGFYGLDGNIDPGFPTILESTSAGIVEAKTDPAESTVSNVNFTSKSTDVVADQEQTQSVVNNEPQSDLLINFLQTFVFAAVLGTLTIAGITYHKRKIEREEDMRERWG